MKVLIADDESIIRLGLKAMLTDLGHTVQMAPDGREALKLVRQSPPDLAILDIHMPFTDGLETAATIARIHPLPVIILTAFAERDLIERASDLPIHGYLVKPVDENNLAAAIAVAVKRFDDLQASARRTAELEDALETRKRVDRAKAVLIKQGLSEDQAHFEIQRRARNHNLTLRAVADDILRRTGH